MKSKLILFAIVIATMLVGLFFTTTQVEGKGWWWSWIKPTPTVTPTYTPHYTWTPKPVPTYTWTPRTVPTYTVTPRPTPTPTVTVTPTPTTPKPTPTPTPTKTITPTPTPKPSPTPTGGNMTIRYVDKDHASASDDGAGTEGNPWATIAYAVGGSSATAAGDTIYVKEGATPYSEQVVFKKSGSAGNIITLQAYPGDSPIIDGTGVSTVNKDGDSASGDDVGLVLINGYASAVNYVTIDGFEIRNIDDSSGLIGIGHQSNIIVKNCNIHDCYICGVMFLPNWVDQFEQGWISNITVDTCVIYNVNEPYGSESLSLLAVTGFEIKNCEVYDNNSHIAIDMKNGTNSGSVHDNEIYSTSDAIYTDLQNIAVNDISIYNNLIYDVPTGGIMFENEGDEACDLSGLTVYNNIIYGCANGIYFGSYSGSFDVCTFTVINNTLYDCDNAIRLLQTYTHYDGVIRNNCIQGSAGQNGIVYADYNDTTKTDPGGNVLIDHDLVYGVGSSKYGTDSVNDDTDFVNAGAANFHIQSTSPAIGAGSTTDAPTLDYDGLTRGVAIDIGAYEYEDGGAPPGVTLSHFLGVDLSTLSAIMGVSKASLSQIMGVDL
jgi:hypothetical protein